MEKTNQIAVLIPVIVTLLLLNGIYPSQGAALPFAKKVS